MPHRRRQPFRTLIRLFAILTLMTGFIPALTTGSVAAQSDTGLTGDTTYVSPQFGYTVTWDAPWQSRARNVTSDPGGFDALTLRNGSSNLRFTGRDASTDTATILDDAITAEIGDVTDAEIISQSAAGDVPLTATLRIRTNTVLIEFQEIADSGAIVEIVLTARTTDFDTILAETQDVVALNGSPVLTGDVIGNGNDATPAVTPTEEAVPTDDVEPTEEAVPTDEVEPTKEADPTKEPESGVDGDTYTSPHYGYTFSWDESVWDVPADGESSQDDPITDTLRLDAATGVVYIYAWDGYEGDASACLQGESDYYEQDDPGVLDWKLAKNADGDPLTDENGTESAWGVYNLTYQNPDDDKAKEAELTDYIECRTLVPGKSILIIFATSDRDNYNDHIDNVQDVIDTIDTSNTATPDSTPDGGEGTPETGNTGDIPGLEGSLFTSPSFDFTLDIPSAWSVEDATIKNGDETLVLADGTSVVTVYATDDRDFTDDLPSCVDAALALVEDDPAYDGIKIDETVNGDPFEGSDDESAYANYTYTNEDGDEYAHFIECSYIEPGESVIVITQDVPYDLYASERSSRREIENAIELP